MFIPNEITSLLEDFDRTHLITVIAFDAHPLNEQSIDDYIKNTKEFYDSILNLRRNFNPRLKDIFYTKGEAFWMMPIKSDYYYWIIIGELSSPLNRNAILRRAIYDFHKNITRITGKNFYYTFSLNNAENKKKIMDIFKETKHRIYEITKIKTIGQEAINTMKKLNEFMENDEKPINFINFDKKEQSISEFLLNHSKTVTDIRSNFFNHLKYIAQSDRDRKAKFMREEQSIIASFLRYKRYDGNFIIELGFNSKQWDASITNLHSNESIFLEITQASPKNSHKVRREIVETIHLLPLKTRMLHQHDIECFPQIIVDSINEKHSKLYPKNYILLIGIAGEYCEEQDFILAKWTDYVKRNTNKGRFTEIYMIDKSRGVVVHLF